MDVVAPPRFGAPEDPNPPPPSPGNANPNPPEPATPIGLGASLLPLSPKQGGKDPSIVWRHFIKVACFNPIILGLNASIVKININVMVRKMVLQVCCNT